MRPRKSIGTRGEAEALLAERYRGRDGLDAGARRRLEHGLLASFREGHPQRKRWTMLTNPRHRTARWLAACAFILLLGIGACQIPSEYQAEVGQAVEISLAAQTAGGPDSGRGDGWVETVVGSLDGLPGVENVSVDERLTPAGYHVGILLWGEKIDPDEVVRELRARFPELADAQISVRPLATTVNGRLGGRIGRALFDLSIDELDPESARQQILEQLREQGYDGDAEVSVENDGDGRVKVEIKLTDDGTGDE